MNIEDFSLIFMYFDIRYFEELATYFIVHILCCVKYIICWKQQTKFQFFEI